jgi:hypothetical protein
MGFQDKGIMLKVALSNSPGWYKCYNHFFANNVIWLMLIFRRAALIGL